MKHERESWASESHSHSPGHRDSRECLPELQLAMRRQGPERSRFCPRSGSPPGPRLHTSRARAGVLSPHHSPFQSLPTALVGVGTPGISCLFGQGPGKAGGETQGFPQSCHSGTRPASRKQGLGPPSWIRLTQAQFSWVSWSPPLP